LLEKIGGLRVLVKVAGFVFLNPDPDQVAADVVAFGEPMKGLAGQEFLRDLALELNVCARCLAMGFHLSEARLDGQFSLVRLSGPRGPLQIQSGWIPL
jgi:hypothetical protein